jgi:arylamine N-acetyltransferase
LENCETSAIGRALANAGYAPKGKRPSREEMSKVAPNHPALKVVKDQQKPAPQDIKEGDVDYWTTPIGASVKTTLAPVTLESAMATVTEILGTAEAMDAPSCNHGHMEWRTGNSKGRDWAGFFCATKGQSGGMDKCPTHWYNLSSNGKWEPQKARV